MTPKHERRSEVWSERGLARRYDELLDSYTGLYEEYHILLTATNEDPDLHDLQHRVTHPHGEINNIEHDTENTHGRDNGLAREVQQLRNEVEHLKTNFERFQDKIDDIMGNENRHQDKDHDLTLDSDRLRNENRDLMERYENIQSELHDLRERHERLHNDKQEFGNQIDRLQDENLELASERARLQAESLPNDTAALSGKTRICEDLMNDLLAQNSDLAAQLRGSELRELQMTAQIEIQGGQIKYIHESLGKEKTKNQGDASECSNQDLDDSPESPRSPVLLHDSEADDSKPRDTDGIDNSNQGLTNALDAANRQLDSVKFLGQTDQSGEEFKQCMKDHQRLNATSRNQEDTITELREEVKAFEETLDEMNNESLAWEHECKSWEARYAGLDADWSERYDDLKTKYRGIAIGEDATRLDGQNDSCAEKCKEWEDKYSAEVSQGKKRRTNLQRYWEDRYDHLKEGHALLEVERDLAIKQLTSEQPGKRFTETSTGISETCAEKCQQWEGKYNALAEDYDSLKMRTNLYDLDHKLAEALDKQGQCEESRDYWRAKYDDLVTKGSSVKDCDLGEQLDQASKEMDEPACNNAKTIDTLKQRNSDLESELQRNADEYNGSELRREEAEQYCRELEERCEEVSRVWAEKYSARVVLSVELAKEWQMKRDALMARLARLAFENGSVNVPDPSEPGDESGDGHEECREKYRAWKMKGKEAGEMYGNLTTYWVALKKRNLELMENLTLYDRKQRVLCEKLDRLVDAVLHSVRRE
ncbi:hypothetical protein T440DRAFT_536542 [Plenodomus tracheiphilus IPT5]|uniref:Uncharacterized protein n=1 Tax=Plenodomus tracheiphilus IPT5 TaxID=1408161 RepID=A0A6A7B200_9PLEO|nr:hypothetical protein T440DRAFT_536542 [Plenodomus tracheiphilus IPT5]